MMHFKINGEIIERDKGSYIIAEIGNNHNGDKETAKKLIRAAAASGANAVKFQTFKALDIVSPKVKSNAYPGWDVSDRFAYWHQFVETLEMPLEWYDELIKLTRKLGLAFISTPASTETAQFLSDKSIDAIKIASMDLNNYPFLSDVDSLGLPVILSTGMSTFEEITLAVKQFKNSPLCLLHCVSNYPLDYKDANLLNIKMLKDNFDLPIGFSNHALGYDLDILAISLGATLIEKHFTLDRKTKNVAEHHFSMTPSELKEMTTKINNTNKALGSYQRVVYDKEEKNKLEFRRSLYSKNHISKNEKIKKEDIIALRPGIGLEPKLITKIVGMKANREIEPFELLKLNYFTLK
jgi:N,N'-diacetyllegionaminate synthase